MGTILCSVVSNEKKWGCPKLRNDGPNDSISFAYKIIAMRRRLDLLSTP